MARPRVGGKGGTRRTIRPTRSEAFLDDAKLGTLSGLTLGVNRPTLGSPINPTLADDGSSPDWGWGYSSVFQDGADTQIVGTVFESSDIDFVHLGYAEWDGATFTRPSLGLVTYDGDTANNLITPGGLTRNQYRVAYDETLGQYVCIVYVDTGSGLAIDIYTKAALTTGAWTSVKRLTNPFGTGYCEPMAFWRRTDGRAVIYAQGVTTGHASYGGLRRHVAMLLGPADGSLTGSWTSQGNILTAPSDAEQYYHAGAFRYGDVLLVPIGVFDGTNTVPTIGTFDGTKNRIHKVILAVTRPDDGTTLTIVDSAWLSSTGVYGDPFGGEVITGNNIAEDGDTYLLSVGGDGNTHHQSPESIRMLALAAGDRGRIGKISGTGSVPLDPVYGNKAGWITANVASGTVEVELLNPRTGAVLNGFSQSDCDTITAGTFGQVVTWNGRAATPASFQPQLYGTSCEANLLVVS